MTTDGAAQTVAQIQEEADRLDKEIASAQSLEDCIVLHQRYMARKLFDALNPTPELRGAPSGPSLRDPADLPDPNLEALKDMTEQLGRMLDAYMMSELYMLSCRRHLHDEGIMSMEESLGRLKEMDAPVLSPW